MQTDAIKLNITAGPCYSAVGCTSKTIFTAIRNNHSVIKQYPQCSNTQGEALLLARSTLPLTLCLQDRLAMMLNKAWQAAATTASFAAKPIFMLLPAEKPQYNAYFSYTFLRHLMAKLILPAQCDKIRFLQQQQLTPTWLKHVFCNLAANTTFHLLAIDSLLHPAKLTQCLQELYTATEPSPASIIPGEAMLSCIINNVNPRYVITTQLNQNNIYKKRFCLIYPGNETLQSIETLHNIKRFLLQHRCRDMTILTTRPCLGDIGSANLVLSLLLAKQALKEQYFDCAVLINPLNHKKFNLYVNTIKNEQG